MSKQLELTVRCFATSQQWEEWLAENHTAVVGLWLQFYKKAAAKKSVTYAEALDIALCYGWIDGHLKSYDADSYVRRFTPRRAKSLWSKRNQEHVARLMQAGLMQPAGLAAVTAAQADGRWDQAIDRKSVVIPPDFLIELKKYPAADAFFKTLNKANIYAIAWKLQTVKQPATRTRRMQVILDMLRQGKRL